MSKPSSLNLDKLEDKLNSTISSFNPRKKPSSLGLGKLKIESPPSKPNLSLNLNKKPNLELNLNKKPNVELNLNKKPTFDLNLSKKPADNNPFKPLNLTETKPAKKTTRFNIPEQPQKNDKLSMQMQLAIKRNGNLNFNGHLISTCTSNFQNMGMIGMGTCGQVYKMLHKPTNHIMAVKQMARTGIQEENKRILMDLEVVQKSHDCPHIVTCYGTFVTESQIWICMELMETCFDKLKKKVRGPLPEPIIGKLSVAVLKALHYLKEKHDVIHRDVKPSNILVSSSGQVKLCDFGISGRLVDSKAKTRNAGCVAYMAPERISPDKIEYDIRADVWSLGISLIELATGKFPYSECQTDFEMLTKILEHDPPSLPGNINFSVDFRRFVNRCCTKKLENRPKYRQLLHDEFIARYERTQIDIGGWLKSLSHKNPQNQNSYIGRKSCTLPRLGDGPPDLEAFKDAVKPKTSGNFCLQRKPAATFSSNHGNQNQGSSGKEDPFAFADNLTANFMKNKGHTRNRSWADSFKFLNLNDNKPKDNQVGDKSGGKNSVSSSVTSSSRDSLHP